MLHQHSDLRAQMPVGRVDCPDALVGWLVFGEDRDEVPTGNPRIDVIVGQLHDTDALACCIQKRLTAIGMNAGIRDKPTPLSHLAAAYFHYAQI